MGVGEGLASAAVDDSAAVVKKFPAIADILGGLGGVRAYALAARDDAGVAGRQADKITVCRGRRAQSVLRARHHEHGFAVILPKALSINRLVGEDFRVRQLAVVEANRVDGARE